MARHVPRHANACRHDHHGVSAVMILAVLVMLRALNVYRVSASACNVPAGGNCPNAAASADYVERVLSSIVER